MSDQINIKIMCENKIPQNTMKKLKKYNFFTLHKTCLRLESREQIEVVFTSTELPEKC